MKTVILLGGKSSRMGVDKALVTYQGKSLLEHAITIASNLNSEFYLSVSEQQFEHLGHHYACIIDLAENKGPLSGIYSAIRYLNDDILVIPVDMPKLSSNTLLTLPKNYITTAFQIGQYIQSLPSYWSVKDIIDIKEELESTNLSLNNFLKSKGKLIPFEGDRNELLNINHPADLLRDFC